MTTNIDDYLDVAPEDVPEAVVLTNGVYRFQIGPWRRDKVGDDQKSKVTISLRPTAMVESDLSDEEFEYAENVRAVFWLTEKAMASKAPHISLVAFLTHYLGLPEEVPIRELLEMTLGLDVVARVSKEMTGKNNDIPQAEVQRYLKVEDED